MDVWAELLAKLVDVSPYAFFVVFVLLGAYFFFKVSVKEIRKINETALKEMRDLYDEALRNARK